MEKMKTALTELKENIDYLFLETKSDTEFQKGFVACLEHVINFMEAKNLLETEKQQIIEAFEEGKQEGSDAAANFEWGIKHKKKTAEYYYNETFKP